MTVSRGDFLSSGETQMQADLYRARMAIDGEIARSAAAERVTRAVLAEVGIAPAGRLRWLRIAAALVVAAGLGGLLETNRVQSSAPLDVVMLDPLTFSAMEVDQ